MSMSTRVLIRRLDVLSLLGEGHTQTEVSDLLGLSVRQVQRVVALHRLGAAVPPDQLPEAIKAALARESNKRRRAMLLHDMAGLAIDEAKALRRVLRDRRAKDGDQPGAQAQPSVVRQSAAQGTVPQPDGLPKGPTDIQRAAKMGLHLLGFVE